MRRKQHPVVYVGPGFRDSRLNTYSIFSDGIPDEYKNHPTYKHLFVRAEELDEARKLVQVKGSMLHTMFQRAIEEHDEKKGGK